jgi:hypothetical protein
MNELTKGQKEDWEVYEGKMTKYPGGRCITEG